MKKSENRSTFLFAAILAVILVIGALTGLMTGMLIAKNNTEEEKLPVSDVFSEVIKDGNITYCYHIPQIRSEAEGINEVNKKIYNTLYQVYSEGVTVSKKNNGFPVLGSMVYTYTVKDDIVSIIVQTQDARTLEYNYFTFNADIKNGCELSAKDMCGLFGTDINAFNTKIRTAVRNYSDREKVNYPADEVSKYIDPIIEKTLSKEYINMASPYISHDGKLFAVVYLFSSGGKDTYPHMMNLDTSIPQEELPMCTAHDSLTEAITNAAAPVLTPEPEVSYVYIESEAETKKEPEKETEKKEEATTQKTASPASSDVLTKELLMSHSWKGYAQFEWEYVFNADGTVDIYAVSVETENYRIDGNTLYIGNTAYEYISLEESDVWKSDDIFSGSVINELKPGEKFFWTDNAVCKWLIDTTGRLEYPIIPHAVYMEFEYEKTENLNPDEYIYFEFATWDIDNDGTEEMIFHEGTCEQDREYHFYTVKNRELIHLGDVHAWHAGLSASDNGLIKYSGMSGEGDYYRITVENGKIKETKEGTYSFPPVPDFGTPIYFHPSLY